MISLAFLKTILDYTEGYSILDKKFFKTTVIRKIAILFFLLILFKSVLTVGQAGNKLFSEKDKNLLYLGAAILYQLSLDLDKTAGLKLNADETGPLKQDAASATEGQIATLTQIPHIPINAISGRTIRHGLGLSDLRPESLGTIVLISGIIVCLILIAVTGRNIRRSFHLLHDFNRRIAQEKQEANERLALSESLLNSMLRGMSDEFFALDNDWRFICLNPQSQAALGQKGELVGKKIWEEFPQAVGGTTYQKLQKVKAKGIELCWETESLGDDRKPLRFRAYPFRGGIAVFAQDPGEEENLKNTLYRLASVVQSSVDGILSISVDGTIRTWNKACERMYGYKATEIVGKPLSLLSPEDLVGLDEDIMEAIRQGKRIDSLDTVHLTKGGQVINVSLSIAPLYDQSKRITGASVIARDITQRINIEDQLRAEIKQRQQSEADFKAVFDKSKLGIVTRGRDKKVIRCNQAFEKMIGYSTRELAEMDWMSITHPEDLEKENALAKELRAGLRDYFELEKRYIRKDGSVLWTNTTVVLGKNDREFTIAFIEDITEKQNYREQIIKYDRLNLIGEMAAGISHEVRNPMAAVRGFLQILQSKKDLSHYESYFTTMIEELDRANHIISEFLSIGRNTPTDMKKENLNSIIESLKPLIEADGYTNDKYLLVELSEVPQLLLNQKEIRQMILNLVRNGFEAMAPGGILTIKTYRRHNKVILAVKDQGSGIKPEIMDKLGTPFFTTKQNGTGLGLGICYGIAARHNANIDIETGPEGTTFFVEFPCLENFA